MGSQMFVTSNWCISFAKILGLSSVVSSSCILLQILVFSVVFYLVTSLLTFEFTHVIKLTPSKLRPLMSDRFGDTDFYT
jgi:hypothetical protein